MYMYMVKQRDNVQLLCTIIILHLLVPIQIYCTLLTFYSVSFIIIVFVEYLIEWVISID